MQKEKDAKNYRKPEWIRMNHFTVLENLVSMRWSTLRAMCGRLVPSCVIFCLCIIMPSHTHTHILYIYICIYTHIYIYICVCVCVYIYICVCVCVYVSLSPVSTTHTKTNNIESMLYFGLQAYFFPKLSPITQSSTIYCAIRPIFRTDGSGAAAQDAPAANDLFLLLIKLINAAGSLPPHHAIARVHASAYVSSRGVKCFRVNRHNEQIW